MGNYVLTQLDKEIVLQSNKEKYCKVEILNKDLKVIDSIEHHLLSDSLSISTDSNLRRSYQMSLLSSKNIFLSKYDGVLWMDKYIRAYTGTKHARSNTKKWDLLGTFMILDNNYNFDETSNTLSVNCSDMMCRLNGSRYGNVTGALTFTIKQGEILREVVIDLLKEAGITRYIVSDMDNRQIPHDFEYSAGTNYYTVLNDIITSYSYYEMFFDVNGVFIIQKYPHHDADSVVLTADFLKPLIISEGLSISYENVFNNVEVWGQSIESDYTIPTCTYASNIYSATLADITTLDNFKCYSVNIPSTNLADAKLKINALGTFNITNDDGTNIKASTIQTGYNVFKYRKTDNNFYWLGQYQVYAKSTEKNVKSPFHPTKIGLITKVCTGSDYDTISSNSLALDRADYELHNSCRLQERVTLELITIPFIDVNWLIEYTSYITGETKKYIIKSVDFSSVEATMSLSLVAFYDEDIYN